MLGGGEDFGREGALSNLSCQKGIACSAEDLQLGRSCLRRDLQDGFLHIHHLPETFTSEVPLLDDLAVCPEKALCHDQTLSLLFPLGHRA